MFDGIVVTARGFTLLGIQILPLSVDWRWW